MKINGLYILIILVVSFLGVLIMFATMIRVKTHTNQVVLKSIEDVPVESWAKLAEKKIFFGHKSVGYNIIDGIKDVIQVHDYIRLNIIETTEPADFEEPVFGHSQVGTNTDPASKVEEFGNILDSGLGDKIDIAFLKFCYVDVMRDSDPKKIFDNYRAVLDDLKSRYPHIKFLNVTVPVCSAPKSLKSHLKESVKLLIGKPVFLDDNIKRHHYNTILKGTYSKEEPVFDLALIETIGPENTICYVNKGKKSVPVMASDYTEDGGHLNYQGRIKAAEQLLIMLAELANDT